jgi:hypothetical protein
MAARRASMIAMATSHRQPFLRSKEAADADIGLSLLEGAGAKPSLYNNFLLHSARLVLRFPPFSCRSPHQSLENSGCLACPPCLHLEAS